MHIYTLNMFTSAKYKDVATKKKKFKKQVFPPVFFEIAMDQGKRHSRPHRAVTLPSSGSREADSSERYARVEPRARM